MIYTEDETKVGRLFQNVLVVLYIATLLIPGAQERSKLEPPQAGIEGNPKPSTLNPQPLNPKPQKRQNRRHLHGLLEPLIHQELKPENVLIFESGKSRLLAKVTAPRWQGGNVVRRGFKS